MKYPELNYRNILEGFAKFNLLILCLLPFVLYFTSVKIAEYFALMKWQVILWIISVLFAKLYDKFRFNEHKQKISIYYSSIYKGIVIACVLGLVFAEVLLHKVEKFEILFTGGGICLGWLLYVFIILKLQEFCKLKWYVQLLDKTIGYKDFFQIFVLINIAFMFVIVIFILLNKKYSLIELLFILLYLELAFFVFHIFVAKIIDLVWHGSKFSESRVSLMGLIVASVLYVIKIRVVEEKFFGIFDDIYINDYKALILITSLSLFWVFFTLLFNFKAK